MLKRVHEIKKGLMESRGVIQNKESIPQTSILKTEIIDSAISFEFTVDIDPDKLDGRRMEIAHDFVEHDSASNGQNRQSECFLMALITHHHTE